MEPHIPPVVVSFTTALWYCPLELNEIDHQFNPVVPLVVFNTQVVLAGVNCNPDRDEYGS